MATTPAATWKTLRQKLEAAGLPEEVKPETMRELNRLARISPNSPEYGVSRTYLEWMASLPWSVSSGSQVDVKRAAEILDEDHYDLEKVKDRILDYLAVLQLRPVLKGPILCFVGPPGVGKTSLGKSIARALGRKFARVSMGGMHDEAEIRGHRRTYIGALPGQIIQALRRAGVNDPVFMLDEVDKLGRDFRGDPASALLEVLDPEQNSTFRDNYLDAPFDLSKVLFITTANVLDPVPDALRDRMEIIPLEGYTEHEKVIIAFRYLIPRQTRENGLDAETDLHFEDESVQFLIRRYTREAGVRSLEREIGAICRKQARRIAEGTTRKGGGDAGTGGARPGRAALPHRHRSGRTHQPARRGGGAGLDAGGRRRALHRSRPHAGRQQGAHHDGPVGSGDAGIGAGRAYLGARQCG
jgi:ATP-dependent Lon protease